jgi:predicted house-cleaning noncanonical NTP pyrophosphatase (MazG superfamily)
LGEELREYFESDSVDELADLLEVVYAILKYKEIDINDFENIHMKKAIDQGAFDKRILLKEVIEE